MLKKTITYVDYNGTQRTEDHYFNLTKAELVEMETGGETGDGSKGSSLRDILIEVVETEDKYRIVQLFKRIIKASYGKKSPDGRRFIKNAEVWEEFSQTNAYSELFLALAGNANEAGEFIKGLMPSDMAEQLQQAPETAALMQNPPKTSEEIRKVSEAMMQGHKQAEPKTVKEEPTTKATPLNLDGMTEEQKADLLRQLQQG